MAYKAVHVPAPPPPTAPLPTLPDGGGVALPAVAGATTTTTLGVSGGSATVSGTVVGPAGSVAGATVLAQRVAAGGEGSLTAVTGPDGRFSLGGLVGGVYRVRAWQAPQLALTTPVTFFLGAGATHAVTLNVAQFATDGVVGVVNPDPPVSGQPVDLAVQITAPTVGADGVVRQPALSGATVALANGPGWEILSGQAAVVTGSDGEANFEIECVGAGPQPLDVQVNGGTPVSLGLPDCAPPPAPPTAPPATVAPTTAPSTTATTAPPPTPTAPGPTTPGTPASSTTSSSSSPTAGR